MAEPQAWFEGFGSSDDGDAVRASLHARNPSDSMQAADLLSLITSATTCADRMMRRRIVSVPCDPFVTGVKLRSRFGSNEAAFVASTSTNGIPALFNLGLPRFCGPGAPKR